MVSRLKRRLADSDVFWDRHANPASGWSRVPTGPLLIYALYARNWTLLATTLAFVVVNPVLFPALDDDAARAAAEKHWITRGVRGEQLWLQGADAGRANWLNRLNVPVSLYALRAAIRRQPRRTAVATALLMTLKLAFVNEMAELYENERARETDAPR